MEGDAPCEPEVCAAHTAALSCLDDYILHLCPVRPWASRLCTLLYILSHTTLHTYSHIIREQWGKRKGELAS